MRTKHLSILPRTTMSTIQVEHSTKTTDALLAELRSGELTIPAHQREFCWPPLKMRLFVDTVQRGMPTQAVIVRNESGIKPSLEDGRQRLTALGDYFDDKYPDEGGKKFSEHTLVNQYRMKTYSFALIRYKNASTEDAIEIFDRFQNGQPLSVGERIFSMSEISPFVKFVQQTLLTAGVGLHDRAKAVWGSRCGADKRRMILLNALALCAGCAWGSGAITMKWEDIRRQKILSNSEWKPANVVAFLERLIAIYTEVEAKQPQGGKKILNQQWKIGTFSGYIIHSLHVHDASEHDAVQRKWIRFLIDERRDTELLDATLHHDVGAARQWTSHRWNMGYLRVFDPEEADRIAAGIDDEAESYEDSGDDE